jgi:Na+/proline symporter
MAAILAAAMANLSAALNSLASTTVIDFFPRRMTDASSLRLARGMTVVWGMVLAGIGMVARHWGSVLEAGLSIASVTLGLLLGVFLLGILTKRVGEWAAILGVLAGLAVILSVHRFTNIAWTWYALIGSASTFVMGWASSWFTSSTGEAR